MRRAKDKKIQVSVKPLDPPAKKGSFLSWPIVRGVVAFIAALKNGMDTINESARMLGDEEEEQPSAFERWLADKLGKKVEDVVVAIAMLVAIVLAVGLFFVLPSLAGSWFKSVIDNRVLANLLEGVVRLAIFLAYILSIAKMKEIRRVFCYHGAEHKTVHCYEHAEELTVENCRKYSIMHPPLRHRLPADRHDLLHPLLHRLWLGRHLVHQAVEQASALAPGDGAFL